MVAQEAPLDWWSVYHVGPLTSIEVCTLSVDEYLLRLGSENERQTAEERFDSAMAAWCIHPQWDTHLAGVRVMWWPAAPDPLFVIVTSAGETFILFELPLPGLVESLQSWEPSSIYGMVFIRDGTVASVDSCERIRVPEPIHAPASTKTRQQMRADWDRMRPLISPAVLELDSYRCRICGASQELTVDHIVPLATGGTNDIRNLRSVCRRCNSRKGAR